MQIAANAAVIAVVVHVESSLLTAAITGNSFKLDIQSLIKSAVTAGVLSYASNLKQLKLDDLNLGETTQQFAQKAIDTTVKTGIQSAVYGTSFKDSLGTNLVVAGTDLIAKTAFKKVGHELYSENYQYKDVLPPKIITHAIIGGSLAKLKGGDFTSGAIATATAHLTSQVMIDNYMDDVTSGKITTDELINRTKMVASITSGLISKVANPKQSDNDLLISNQIAKSNVDNNSLKLITTAIKIARKLKNIKGKITKDKLKDIGLDEIAGIIEDGSTILDPSASLAEKAMAVADLLIGTEFNSKKTKVVKKSGGKVYGKNKKGDVVEVKEHEVGEYKKLNDNDVVGDNLDNHHVPQKDLAKKNKTINYPKDTNSNTAPAIRVNSRLHKQISAQQTKNKVARSKMTPRELLADDSKMLREIGVPNKQIQEIIELNKIKYGLKK